jgi:hypothetical protein
MKCVMQQYGFSMELGMGMDTSGMLGMLTLYLPYFFSNVTVHNKSLLVFWHIWNLLSLEMAALCLTSVKSPGR